MEKNKINENISLSEEQYNELINKTIDKMKKYKDVKLSGKILHYLERPTLYYYCTVISNKKSNPFDLDIIFSFEFIDGEIPYATILTDFIEPSLNDNRNYYRCLTKDYKYKFSLDNFIKHETILESMIEGIGNFLAYLSESIALKSFIFFGEYEYDHIYSMNDFFQYKNYLNFYRINEIKKNKNKFEERYIIFTKLYFLLFAPYEEDKALAKLLFFQKLKDINFIFDKNEQKNSLILKINNKKYKNDIEFLLIDRKSKEKKEELNLIEEEEEFNEIIEKDKQSDYSILMNEWFSYQDNINFKNYDIVLSKYKLFFKDNKRKMKVKEINSTKIQEYNKYIQFNENLISLYEKINNTNNERINKMVSNIIYICSELVDYGDSQNGKDNEYLMKIRKYIISKNKK